jgi:hypothetical protein
MRILNCTPHPIIFKDGEKDIKVEPSGFTLKADPVESVVSIENGITFVRTEFIASDKGRGELREIKEKFYNSYIVVGSIISAQAFPGEVVALVSAPGFERKPPAEKRFLLDKFIIF